VDIEKTAQSLSIGERDLGISNSNLYTTHPPEIYNIETQIDVFFWKVPPFKYGYAYAYFSASMLNFKGLWILDV